MREQPAPDLRPCPGCGKELPTKLVETTTRLSGGGERWDVRRVWEEHGCGIKSGILSDETRGSPLKTGQE